MSQGREVSNFVPFLSTSPTPHRSVTFSLQEADESLNFEEQILEAAKSIAAATSALVKAASAAQRELVAQGKVSTLAPEEQDKALTALASQAALK